MVNDSITFIDFADLTPEESELVLRWRNHPDVTRNMFTHHITPKEHRRFLESLPTKEDTTYWLVKEGHEYIGVCHLSNIDKKQSEAYLGIYVNPEEKIPGRGQKILKKLVDITFHEIGLQKLKLEVFDFNDHAIRFYQKFGFRETGREKNVISMELENI